MSGWTKGLFCFGVFVAVLYAGIQFGMPYFRYYQFKSDASDIVMFPGFSADDIKAKIVAKAAEDGVMTLDPGNVSVQADGRHYDAQASWSVPVDVYGYYHRQLDFSFDVNAEGSN
ncbi:MAG: hypothetical protein M0Z75_03295 [Nitrospiraceae bacterium]|nr:hypothetical protein [Nitrospiraceae bacterium]